MKKVLSLLAVAGIVAGFAAPAHADEFVARYTYLVNGANYGGGGLLTQPAVINGGYGGYGGYGACGGNVITQPAVIDSCGAGVLTQPAVVNRPIMVEDHENIVPHFFHLGVWPLVDFSIF